MRSCGVLILILMEHAQRGRPATCQWQTCHTVLILILMEHAQRVVLRHGRKRRNRLNPYFNGTCSKSVHKRN